MPKYLLIYHGGSGISQRPEEAPKTMQAWMAWFGKIQPSVVDGGNPISRGWTVTKDGTTEDAGANPASGYSVLKADSMQEALEMAMGCPHLEDGGSIELCETVEMG
jgi:hypothetical protein